MNNTFTTNQCRVWRHDGGRKTTEGRLDLAGDGSLTFRDANGDEVWTTAAADVKAKSPWYSLGASLKISEPSPARGLYMAYPPKNMGPVSNSIDTAKARRGLKMLRTQLTGT